MVLTNEIAKYMEDFSKQEIIKNIERTHCVTPSNKNTSATSVPPSRIAKITN